MTEKKSVHMLTISTVNQLAKCMHIKNVLQSNKYGIMPLKTNVKGHRSYISDYLKRLLAFAIYS